MNTKPKSGVRGLSERGQAILHRLLDQHVPADSIARVLWLHTRERLSPEAIARYASRYGKRQQEQQRLKEKLDGFLGQARSQGVSVSDLLRAVLIERLSSPHADPSLRRLDVLKLEAAERLRSGLELRREQVRQAAELRRQDLALKERQVLVAEGRYQLDREKFQAAINTLERKAAAGKRLTPLDVNRVKALYGLYEEQSVSHDDHQTETQETGAR
jgi:hypothetical protein